MRELAELEEQYPELITADSTQRVGHESAPDLPPSSMCPLLSLSNAFSFEELEAFQEGWRGRASPLLFVCELKIDGLSCPDYQDGVLCVGY